MSHNGARAAAHAAAMDPGAVRAAVPVPTAGPFQHDWDPEFAEDPTPGTTALVKAHTLLGRYAAGRTATVPSADVIDQIVNLLYRAANPNRITGRHADLDTITYPTKRLPAPMLAQIAATGALPIPGVGAAMLGCGSAACMGTRLLIDDTRSVVPTLWVPSAGDPGSGKTPAADLAFAPYREREDTEAKRYVAAMLDWQSMDRKERAGRTPPQNTSKLSEDATVELLARRLSGGSEAVALVTDELATVLRGIGQYKKGGGSDKARFLALWSGKSWTYERVGTGENPIFIHISRPVLPVFGTIQPELVDLLGDVGSGMQSRWLPHWCAGLSGTETGRTAPEWESTVRVLLNDLDRPRVWTMPRECEARRELLAAEERWRDEATDKCQTSASTSFLAKGGEHAARIALVLAEVASAGDSAAAGQRHVPSGQMPVWAVRAAVDLVDYCTAVWRTLPGSETPLTQSYAEARIAEKDGVLNAWLRKHGGSATKREIQAAKVAGARTPTAVKALIDRHREIYGEDSTVLEARGQLVVYAR